MGILPMSEGLTWKNLDMMAGTLTVTPGKTEKPLVQSMAGEHPPITTGLIS
jgi:hypothetical protein